MTSFWVVDIEACLATVRDHYHSWHLNFMTDLVTGKLHCLLRVTRCAVSIYATYMVVWLLLQCLSGISPTYIPLVIGCVNPFNSVDP